MPILVMNVFVLYFSTGLFDHPTHTLTPDSLAHTHSAGLDNLGTTLFILHTSLVELKLFEEQILPSFQYS